MQGYIPAQKILKTTKANIKEKLMVAQKNFGKEMDCEWLSAYHLPKHVGTLLKLQPPEQESIPIGHFYAWVVHKHLPGAVGAKEIITSKSSPCQQNK